MDQKQRLKEAVERLMTLSVNNIVTDERLFSFREIQRELSTLFSAAKTANSYPDFIEELPDRDAEQLAGEIEALYSKIDEISAHRYDSEWLSPNYNGTIDEIRNRYAQLYKLLVVPVREYASSLGANEKRIQDLIADLSKAREESKSTIEQAQEATADISTVELSHHFESLVGVPMNYSWSRKKREFKRWKVKYVRKAQK